jgi:hypothetical protein
VAAASVGRSGLRFVAGAARVEMRVSAIVKDIAITIRRSDRSSARSGWCRAARSMPEAAASAAPRSPALVVMGQIVEFNRIDLVAVQAGKPVSDVREKNELPGRA